MLHFTFQVAEAAEEEEEGLEMLQAFCSGEAVLLVAVEVVAEVGHSLSQTDKCNIIIRKLMHMEEVVREGLPC